MFYLLSYKQVWFVFAFASYHYSKLGMWQRKFKNKPHQKKVKPKPLIKLNHILFACATCLIEHCKRE